VFERIALMLHSRLLVRRTGRWLFWRRPLLYWPFGVVRHGANCLARDFDMWIEGYPRSANTFCVTAFKLANPTVRVRSHRHIPSYTIHALACRKPGIFLLRKPADAVISWTIYGNRRLGECLDYYTDFHRALRPHLPKLFIATFEQVTCRFDQVIEQFNRRFGVRYAALANDPATIARCFAEMDGSADGAGPPVDERLVCRPSAHRDQLKPALLQQLQSDPRLRRKLDRANDLYLEFRSGARSSVGARASVSTRQLPTMG
jgi:hypothetical protein